MQYVVRNPTTNYNYIWWQNDDEQPALYVGVHQKQLYIQQSSQMRNRVTHATKIFTAEAAAEGM